MVGPRPERPEFVELFEPRVHRYYDRHRVKAGITGWAQVNGLRGRTSLSDRVEWDNLLHRERVALAGSEDHRPHGSHPPAPFREL
jgi:lipopolysaccharide/colanic/teichoic acid biosynthesis glycosyltransferase